MICPTCRQPVAGGKIKRICATCMKPIGRNHKYTHNAWGQCVHRLCSEPNYRSESEKQALINREMPLFDRKAS